jgi:hypothetical protein
MDKTQVFGAVAVLAGVIAFVTWPLSEKEQAAKERSVASGLYMQCMSTLSLAGAYAISSSRLGGSEDQAVSKVADISGASLAVKRDVIHAAIELDRSSISSEEVQRRLHERVLAHCEPLTPKH